MDMLAPVGPVYQAGTLSGNPVAVAAGITTLGLLAGVGTYDALETKAKKLEDGFRSILSKYRIRGTINRLGSIMTLFFGVDRVITPHDARQCDRRQFASFFHGMLKRGVYLPPSPFEAMFVSLAHTNADLREAVGAFDDWARADGTPTLIEVPVHVKNEGRKKRQHHQVGTNQTPT
jgi:glutamate-1-semialdehyde 2,1-aminomutase